jgi:hypothetical protein
VFGLARSLGHGHSLKPTDGIDRRAFTNIRVADHPNGHSVDATSSLSELGGPREKKLGKSAKKKKKEKEN